jgi:general secretion pathway protein A
MYHRHFGLAEAPFSIAPDPRYLYLSQRHQEALAHLLYGVNGSGGFVLLTGEVGAGKTTVCRCLLEQIPETCDVAFIFNPRLTVEELLSTICTEFGIAVPDGNTSVKVFIDRINAYLLDAHARGRQSVLIIDEAQNLSPEVLEQMRLLTNLETNERKLLQIILLGQPELAEMLSRPELRQLAQRVVARYHLGPLDAGEIGPYVEHRLAVSGAERALFPGSLMPVLYRLTGGVPRLINLVCDRALLGTYAQGRDRVDRKTLMRAAKETLPHPLLRSLGVRPRIAAAALAGLAAVAAFAAYHWAGTTPAREASVAAAPVSLPPAPKANEVVPASEKPEPAKETVLQSASWPRQEALAKSEPLAWSALFDAWGAEYDGRSPCRQASALKLRCKMGRGGLDELRRANRPAVLRLRGDDGQLFHAALLQLDGQAATLSVGDETQKVSLAGLAQQWTGDYTLLWRPPPVPGEAIAPRARGPAVDWLAQQLAQVSGQPAAVHEEYDEALLRQVKQFQLEQGLTPDGSVGPQTLIRLSALADSSAPSLTAK